MNWTSLLAAAGVLAFSAGCATKTQSAAPATAPTPQEEPLVVVQTPESGMLPGAQQWEWTPPEHPTHATTESQMMPTRLGADLSAKGRHLKKRPPKKGK